MSLKTLSILIRKVVCHILALLLLSNFASADGYMPTAVGGLVMAGQGIGKIANGISPFHLKGTDRHGRSKVGRLKCPTTYVWNLALGAVCGAHDVTMGVLQAAAYAPVDLTYYAYIGGIRGSRYVYRGVKKGVWHAMQARGKDIPDLYQNQGVGPFSGEQIETMTQSNLPVGVISSKVRRTLAKQRIALAVQTEELTEENINRWTAQASNRIKQREKAFISVSNQEWKENENIMRTESTIAYLKAINSLDQRYPLAVPHAEIALHQIYDTMENLDISNRGKNAEKIRQAALRYLDRLATEHRYDSNFLYTYAGHGGHVQDPRSNLKSTQILSLAWAAIHDRKVFVTDQEVEDRQWGLLYSLALIQRLNNITDNKIDFNYSKKNKDDPTCSMGTFKRLIEHLDLNHPDVKFTSIDVNAHTIANDIATREIVQTHKDLFGSKTSAQQLEIRNSFDSQARPYVNYLSELRSEIHARAPLIPADQIQRLSNESMMSTLLDLDES
jgi:hypothetical protein